jgi:hypothetical protein
MTALLPALLVVALLGPPPPPRTYYWRDTSGQTHITNTPPPREAELLDAPPPVAVEPGQTYERPVPIRQSASHGDQRDIVLTVAQQQVWSALDRELAKARAAGDQRTLQATGGYLIQDCLWGSGLWAMPLLPILSILLMGLLGWWMALGLPARGRLPLVLGFLAMGVAFGHLLLTVFLYHPQAVRLRQNLELLEYHSGLGRPLRPEQRSLLQVRYHALEDAADPLQPPWRFPKEVQKLRETLRQVMVAP